MFFDNSKFFEFKDLCEKKGINVPIIPGLKPISTIKQMNLIPHRFHCDLPEDLKKTCLLLMSSGNFGSMNIVQI